MFKATFQSLLAHRVRLTLSACATALGVAFVAGTLIFTATVQHGLNRLFDTAAAGTDVVVRHVGASAGAGGNGKRQLVPAGLLARVRLVPGVAAADGAVTDRAGIIGRDGRVVSGRAGLAASWPAEAVLARAYTLRQGRPPTGPGDVAIDAATARGQGLHVGDQVRVVVGGTARPFTISAITGFGSGDGPGVASLAVFDLATAQQLFGKQGRFDEIDLSAAGGVSAATLRDRVAAVLPGGVGAVTAASAAAAQAAQLEQSLGFLTNALLAFALLALFVASFIIWNTFSILVAQRTRELALLRALGAGRGQVLRSVLVEAGAVGTVASLAGLGMGALAARGLGSLLGGAGINLPTSDLQFRPSAAAIAVGLGVAVTVAAAVAPARRATRVAPLVALRDAAATPSPFSRRRLAVGLGLLVLGACALAAGLLGHLGAGLMPVGGGALASFLGVTTLGPLVARPLAWAVGAPLCRLRGSSGRLARQNAMRNPKRTAATAAALMVGLALVAATAVLVASVKRTAEVAIDRGSRADLYVQPGGEDGVLGPALARAVAAQPGVAAVLRVRTTDATVAGTAFQKVDGVDPATLASLADLDVRSGGIDALAGGGLLVSTSAATAHHWTLGSQVAVGFGQAGTTSFRVAGTYASKGAFGDYLLGLDAFSRATGATADSMLMVKAAPGSPPAPLRARIGDLLGPYPGAKVLDAGGFKQAGGATLDSMLNLITALLALAVLIALLGIVNTLALSIVERTRELGLLRAIGMRRPQVAAMIAGEAVIIAVVGAALGTALGIGLGGALAAALTAGQGGSPVVVLPGGQLLAYVALAAVAGVLAAIAPARRAARLDVLAAIATQ
jgi:putative ABC transport system permease protein